METRQAARPAAPWVERLLAKKVIARQKEVDHTCYVEPFVGTTGRAADLELKRGLRVV